MADMLGMPACQIVNPMPFLILMKTHNCLFHEAIIT